MVPTRSDGEPTFYFSDPNNEYEVNGETFRGSGHVSFNNDSGISGEALIGFAGDTCRVTGAGESCAVNEVCVLKASSNTTNAHVASCTQPNYPHINNYQHKICCTPTEYCRDGIDNTGDGLIDCQSPECHPSPVTDFIPERCDPAPEYLEAGFGNFQNTSGCVIGYDVNDVTIYNESCLGVSPADSGWLNQANIDNWPFGFPANFQYDDLKSPYHCSYGFRDDGSATDGMGFCCPPDTIAKIHPVTGAVSCQPFSECGVGTDFICLHDHRINFVPDWITYYYSDDPDDWCVSKVGDYFNPINFSTEYTSSMGCCFVSMYGKFGFYHNDKNVKIFGYE